MTIYQTSNMEEALHKMSAANKLSVLYESYSMPRRIPIKYSLIGTLPIYECRAWESFSLSTISKWRTNGGILHYRPSVQLRPSDKCDAMLIVESPLLLRDFADITYSVSRDVVVYRPPNWDMQEEALRAKWPRGSELKALIETITLLPLTGDEVRFEAKDVSRMLNINERRINDLLRSNLKKYFSSYTAYQPVIRPTEFDGDLREMYDHLECEPSQANGIRLLRSNRPSRKAPAGFHRQLKELIRRRFVIKGQTSYRFNMNFKQPDYVLMDAISNARYSDWYKLRNIIENAKEYLTC